MKAKSSTKTVFYCSECGNETAKWMGQCPACGAWNTLVEAPKEPKMSLGTRAKRIAQPKLISELDAEEELRFSTGIGEFDRVLGGGAVRGSLVLVGGAPGIGKSTLLLQLCGRISEQETILYVSGEESQRQLKMRAQRLGVDHGSIYVLAETDLNTVLATIDDLQPTVLIVDSIQTMYDARARGRAKRAVQKRIGTIYQDFALVEPASCRQNVLNACLPDMALPAALLGLFSRAHACLKRQFAAGSMDEVFRILARGAKRSE